MQFELGTDTIIAMTGVGVGVAIAAIQIWFNARHERFMNTLRIIDRLEDREVLSIRHRIDDIMAAAETHNFDFEKLSDEDRAALSSVAKLFGLVGVLARRNSIDKSVIYRGWARNISKTAERLDRYFDWRLGLKGGKALIGDFKWLARKVRHHYS